MNFLSRLIILLYQPFMLIDKLFCQETWKCLKYEFMNNQLFVAWRNLKCTFKNNNLDNVSTDKYKEQKDNKGKSERKHCSEPEFKSLDELFRKLDNDYRKWIMEGSDLSIRDSRSGVRLYFSGDEGLALMLDYEPTFFRQNVKLVGGMHMMYDDKILVLKTAVNTRTNRILFENKNINYQKPTLLNPSPVYIGMHDSTFELS